MDAYGSGAVMGTAGDNGAHNIASKGIGASSNGAHKGTTGKAGINGRLASKRSAAAVSGLDGADASQAAPSALRDMYC